MNNENPKDNPNYEVVDPSKLDDYEVELREGAYEQVPAGEYRAKLTQVTTGEGKYGGIYRAVFEITDNEELKGKSVSALVNKTGKTPKSTLWKVVTALTGSQKIKKLNLQSLIGCQVMITVEIDGSYNKITAYKAVEKEVE